MATYTELYDQLLNGQETTLRNRVEVAALIKANAVLEAGTPADQLALANSVLAGDTGTRDKLFRALVAANNGQDISTILAATDATIQTKVDAAFVTLATV